MTRQRHLLVCDEARARAAFVRGGLTALYCASSHATPAVLLAALFTLGVFVVLVYLHLYLLVLLPVMLCAGYRRVRLLPWVGVPYAAALAGLPWWFGFLPWLGGLGVFVFFCCFYLLPDPVGFFIRPRRRRAFLRAIEYAEGRRPPVKYHQTWIRDEGGRHLVSVSCGTWWWARRPGLLELAVRDDGTVEELPAEEFTVEDVWEEDETADPPATAAATTDSCQ